MATHASVLAWRIPWTEKPGGLQSIVSHRVRRDWSDLACTHTHRNYRSFQEKVKGEFVELSFPNRTNDCITATTRINGQLVSGQNKFSGYLTNGRGLRDEKAEKETKLESVARCPKGNHTMAWALQWAHCPLNMVRLPSCAFWGFLEASTVIQGFPWGSDGKESTCNAGYPGSIPGSGRSPGEGNGYPLQYSCLGNPMDRGAWWAIVHGVAKSQTRLSDSEHTVILWLPYCFTIYWPTSCKNPHNPFINS